MQNRQSGLGTLQGFVVGLGIGTAYGLVRPSLREVSKLRAGAVLCLVAIAGSDGPAEALGVMDLKQMDLKQMSPNAWLSEIVSHLAHGLATAISYDAPANNGVRV